LSAAASLRLRSWQLFAVAVLIWGTTWHAIVYQLQGATPEFGVAVRFALAGAICLAWAAWRGERWRVSAREHALLAFQGVFMYSVSYLCVYHAEKHVPSGLVAVGYSVSPLVNGVISHWIWRTALTARFIAGGVLGVLGVVLIFWHQFGGIAAGGSAALGAAFTVGAVLLSSVGSLASSRNRIVGLPFWPALGWGMLYGAALSGAVVLASGQPLQWPTAPSWWLSLAYLALAGSVVAFACYLALQHRLGPGPASMVGVATPVLALVVSAFFEGYRPDALAVAGVVIAVAGNVLSLMPARAATVPSA
jgi:drug/metabolite transporter (DMT)-like permease